MATKNLIPRGSGEGGIGIQNVTWGEGYFDTGNFNKGLYVSGQSIDAVVSQTITQGGLGGKWDDGTNAGDIKYDGGKVGIGTSNPSYMLDIDATHYTEDPFYIKKGGDSFVTCENGGDFIVGSLRLNNTNTPEVKSTAVGQNGSFTFYTAEGSQQTAERMVINYEGVGIGTANPITKLDIRDSSNTQALATFGNGGGSAPATVHIIEDEQSANHVGLFVGTSNLDSAVLMTKHTSVGIGTRNPDGNLDINSKTTRTTADQSIASIRLQNGFASIANSALINARTDDTTSGVTDYTDKVGLMFATMGDERMRINSAGNVGIGTPNPITKLDIHGTLSFKSAGTYVSPTNAGGDVNSNDLTLTAANSTNSIVARSAQNIIFQVFESAPASVYREVMRITPWNAGANVGIGTANPGSSNKLYVNGNIFANGTITPTSDDRVKHNEQNIVGAIETLSKLTPKKYIKTTEMYEADHDFELDADGNPVDDNGEPVKHTVEAGVIAQKVLEVPELAFMVSPEGVDEDGNVTSPHGLNYNSLFTYAIAAIQEQQQIIEDLKSRIETLENK